MEHLLYAFHTSRSEDRPRATATMGCRGGHHLLSPYVTPPFTDSRRRRLSLACYGP